MIAQSLTVQSTFEQWRDCAKTLLRAQIAPDQVMWEGNGLFAEPLADSPDHVEPSNVPKVFVSAAQAVACHRDPGKWSLLYRLLWRLTHGEKHLLDLAVDDDVHRLTAMHKEVRRDAHKMKAFVRFRRVEDESGEQYVAWHQPDHLIVRWIAPFFRGRFAAMRWTILTPDASVNWDGERLSFGQGVPRSAAPSDDELEACWRTYYGATFNPARIRTKAMKKEMPRRYWHTLPETADIEQLLRDAPNRVETMIQRAKSAPIESALPFVPPTLELPVLRQAAAGCEGCSLHCNATQTVFGRGPGDATLMIIGEQPGDQEDRAGLPFVGPAGQVLNDALIEAGLKRDELYLTNAVKHFKFEQRGTKRIHAKPSAREVAACQPWLIAEIAAVKPKMILCLGATAGQSLFGQKFRLADHRGVVQRDTRFAPWLLTTVHPSFLLRIPDPALKQRTRAEFIEHMRLAASALHAFQRPAA